MAKQKKILVSLEERSAVTRLVREWLNTYPDKPYKVDYEYLPKDKGITLSTIQAAYKTKQYIDGTYEAQYQFYLILRVLPENADERLQATESLDAFGAWCEANMPQLGDNMTAKKVVCTNNSALYIRYENGVEDYQIALTLTYEVM